MYILCALITKKKTETKDHEALKESVVHHIWYIYNTCLKTCLTIIYCNILMHTHHATFVASGHVEGPTQQLPHSTYLHRGEDKDFITMVTAHQSTIAQPYYIFSR